MKIKDKKRISLWVALGALTTAAVASPIAIAYTSQKTSTSVKPSTPTTRDSASPKSIDYQELRHFLAENFSQKAYENTRSKNLSLRSSNAKVNEQRQLTSEEWAKVHESQNKLVTYFEDNNFDSNQITDYLKKNYPEAEAVINEANAEIKGLQVDDVDNSSGVVDTTIKTFAAKSSKVESNKSSSATEINDSVLKAQLNESLAKLQDVSSGLISLRKALAIAGAAAAVAATAFYATSWLFAATVPFAAACTAISATCIAASFGLYAHEANWDINWASIIKTVEDAIKEGNKIYTLAGPIITGAIGVITSFSWAFPVAVSVAGSLAVIASLILYFQ